SPRRIPTRWSSVRERAQTPRFALAGAAEGIEVAPRPRRDRLPQPQSSPPPLSHAPGRSRQQQARLLRPSLRRYHTAPCAARCPALPALLDPIARMLSVSSHVAARSPALQSGTAPSPRSRRRQTLLAPGKD